VNARCPFDGLIEQQRVWNSVAVTSPEECVYETQSRYGSLQRPYKFAPEKNTTLWSEWVGDFKYLKCTEIEQKTFYQREVAVGKNCVAAQLTRSRIGVGGPTPFKDISAWGPWSGKYNYTKCTEVAEQTRCVR
jgi:hypothetical protein